MSYCPTIAFWVAEDTIPCRNFLPAHGTVPTCRSEVRRDLESRVEQYHFSGALFDRKGIAGISEFLDKVFPHLLKTGQWGVEDFPQSGRAELKECPLASVSSSSLSQSQSMKSIFQGPESLGPSLQGLIAVMSHLCILGGFLVYGSTDLVLRNIPFGLDDSPKQRCIRQLLLW